MTNRPICEDCGLEMHPFAAMEGNRWVEGYGCDSCGWSFDTNTDDEPNQADYSRSQKTYAPEEVQAAIRHILGREIQTSKPNAFEPDLIEEMIAASIHCFMTKRAEDGYSKVLREALTRIKHPLLS